MEKNSPTLEQKKPQTAQERGAERLERWKKSLGGSLEKVMGVDAAAENLRKKIAENFERARTEGDAARKKRLDTETGWRANYAVRLAGKPQVWTAKAVNFFEAMKKRAEVNVWAETMAAEVERIRRLKLAEIGNQLREGKRGRLGEEVEALPDQISSARGSVESPQGVSAAPARPEASVETPPLPEIDPTKPKPPKPEAPPGVNPVVASEKDMQAYVERQGVVNQKPAAEQNPIVASQEDMQAYLERYFVDVTEHREAVAGKAMEAKQAATTESDRGEALKAAKRSMQGQIMKAA